jgi:hypothetical protein
MANENRILGDIRPRTRTNTSEEDRDKSMVVGFEHDRTEHPGSRDVTERTAGGTDTDIRNRPE